MAFRFKDKKEIKTFVLYLLVQIDRPVDMTTLNDIVMQDDFVNQFDFFDAFFELCSSGAINKEDKDGNVIYSLSSKGRVAAQMLESDLSTAIKERSARSAMRLLSFERLGARASSELVEKDGKYMLCCSVSDNGGKILSIELSPDTKRHAETMKHNFDERPEFVYRALLGVLTGDINYLADSWIADEDAPDDEE